MPITEADDLFHFQNMSDRWWETETFWFSFSHPERKLGGWLYTMVRPNIGTVAGGTWIWDAAAYLPWEVPYSTNYTALRLPPDADPRAARFPNGVNIEVLEPLRRYRLGVEDGARLFLDLTFEAIMPPEPLAKDTSVYGPAGHFDQFGWVQGAVVLHGETIDVDCIAIRDRSWGPRAEHRPPRSAYVTGATPGRTAFLAVTGRHDERDIVHGFLLREGRVAKIKGQREVRRCPTHGWVTHVVIEARDGLGRALRAEGQRLSGMIINRHTFIDSNSLIEWRIDDEIGHGEDQDMWPVHDWSAARRAARVAELLR
jgi:hypothetical protein